jgi:hypothetical protein
MTEHEQASIDAFNDLLSVSGKTFTTESRSVRGLVQLIEPENANYTLETGEGQDAIIQVLREDLPTQADRQGTKWEIEDDGLNFRIKSSRKDSLFYHLRSEVY